MKNKRRKRVIVASALCICMLFIYFLQTYWVHRKFHDHGVKTECVSLLGWFTMEDHLVGEVHQFTDLQPGDILITLSTHSLGWRHGHAALVIDENTTLECVTWGTTSKLRTPEHWKRYSNCVLLRIKDVTNKEQEDVVAYALENLLDVDYHLSAGFIGGKDICPEDPQFGLQCGYLVWYAWKQMGYDIDSNGGSLVTPKDIMYSEYLEVVEIYGMDEELRPIQ